MALSCTGGPHQVILHSDRPEHWRPSVQDHKQIWFSELGWPAFSRSRLSRGTLPRKRWQEQHVGQKGPGKREGEKRRRKKKRRREKEKRRRRKRKGKDSVLAPRGGGPGPCRGAKHAKGPVLRHKLSISVAKLKAPFWDLCRFWLIFVFFWFLGPARPGPGPASILKRIFQKIILRCPSLYAGCKISFFFVFLLSLSVHSWHFTARDRSSWKNLPLAYDSMIFFSVFFCVPFRGLPIRKRPRPGQTFLGPVLPCIWHFPVIYFLCFCAHFILSLIFVARFFLIFLVCIFAKREYWCFWGPCVPAVSGCYILVFWLALVWPHTKSKRVFLTIGKTLFSRA